MIQAKSSTAPADVAPGASSALADAVGGTVVPAARFFHLDALRAALMFWGILVHTSTLDPSNRVFRACAEISGLVRMEAFFTISGFLAYMLLKKYGAKVTVRKRLVAVGIPFAAALLLLNPVTNHLIHNYHNAPVGFGDYLAGREVGDPRGPMNWHLHLWFLAALFVYSLLAPVIAGAVDAGLRALGDRMESRSGGALFLGMSAGVALCCIGARVGFEVLKPMLPSEGHYVIRSIGNFLPFYALGMMLFASPRLREVFSELHEWHVVLSCAMLVSANHLAGENPDRLQEVFILAAQAYVAVSLSSLLFWLAGKCVRHANPAVRLLADSAYTVYLFHFVAIYLLAHLLRPWISGSGLLALVAVATFALTLLLHLHVIRRVPVLELLFNGKPLRRNR